VHKASSAESPGYGGPQRTADGARHSGFGDEQLHHEICQEFGRRRVAAIDEAAQQFKAGIGRGSGLATEGLDGVTAALRAGAVETLIIGDIGDATVVAGDDLGTVAPNENVLSELGTAPADGVGAILRYSLR
jgi:hypothetical protein